MLGLLVRQENLINKLILLRSQPGGLASLLQNYCQMIMNRRHGFGARLVCSKRLNIITTTSRPILSDYTPYIVAFAQRASNNHSYLCTN